MSLKKKILIITNQPVTGGVPSMLRFVIDCLNDRSYSITLAYYEPYSITPKLSVPFYKLLFARPSIKYDSFYGCRCIGVGCWFPELESSHYWLSQRWLDLIAEHDTYMMVSGSCLAALPYVQTQTSFLGWVATDWQGDREHRIKQFSWVRKLVDSWFSAPAARRLERKIIAANGLVALSEYTATMLNQIVDQDLVSETLYMPIDENRFSPNENHQRHYRVGFIARFEDPRKNITLLLNSIALIVEQLPQVELLLVGDKLSRQSQRLIVELGIDSNVKVIDHSDNNDLPDILRGLDVFALPSYQEGLCIAALEAMSCGVPVVSTYCGGPENYIVDGHNGLLCHSTPASMSSAILQLLTNKIERKNYAIKAREVIIQRFSLAPQRQKFWNLFDNAYS